MSFKNKLKLVRASLKGALGGLLLWPGLTVAIVPIAVWGVYKNPERKGRVRVGAVVLGFLLGLLFSPCVAILGITFPFIGAYIGYERMKENSAVGSTNETLRNFLEKYPTNMHEEGLSEEHISQFEKIIEKTEDADKKTEYNKLLEMVRGEVARTPLTLEDYYTLTQPITVTQTVKDKNGVVTQNEQLYEKSELINHVDSATKQSRVAYNPLIPDHSFLPDENHECTFTDIKTQTEFSYRFSYGFSEKVKDAIKQIRGVLAGCVKELVEQIAPTNSTAHINNKLNIKDSPEADSNTIVVLKLSKNEQVSKLPEPSANEVDEAQVDVHLRLSV